VPRRFYSAALFQVKRTQEVRDDGGRCLCVGGHIIIRANPELIAPEYLITFLRLAVIAWTALAPIPGTPGVLRGPESHSSAPRSAVGALGLEVSLGGLFQTQFIKGEVGNDPLQAGVLPLQVFEPLDLIHLEAAVFVAPTIVGLLGDTERTADVSHGLSLTQGNLGFTQCGEDLFDGVTKTWHAGLLSARP
jgi:hypothetical protein